MGPLSSKTLPSAIAATNTEAGVSQLAMCVMNDSSKIQSADKNELTTNSYHVFQNQGESSG